MKKKLMMVAVAVVAVIGIGAAAAFASGVIGHGEHHAHMTQRQLAQAGLVSCPQCTNYSVQSIETCLEGTGYHTVIDSTSGTYLSNPINDATLGRGAREIDLYEGDPNSTSSNAQLYVFPTVDAMTGGHRSFQRPNGLWSLDNVEYATGTTDTAKIDNDIYNCA